MISLILSIFVYVHNKHTNPKTIAIHYNFMTYFCVHIHNLVHAFQELQSSIEFISYQTVYSKVGNLIDLRQNSIQLGCLPPKN
jgi:hypothetical protein